MRICGLDEVGRGALAGPLVAAAAILEFKNQNSKIKNVIQKLKDSKKLNSRQREEIFQELMSAGVNFQVEIISARQINNRGIGWANKEIFRRLIKRVNADRYIIDGPPSLYPSYGRTNRKVKCIIGADQTRRCVMAASIIAKVTRDELMKKLHEEHSNYGWDENAGYGTKKHIKALRIYGEVRYHRSVFVTTALK
jgi:ribonuclease HII